MIEHLTTLNRYVDTTPLTNAEGNVIGEKIDLYQSPTELFKITSGREGKYLGCGIDTAQSFLKWYGIDIPQIDLADSYIKTGSFPWFKEIFTLPSWLKDGIEKVLIENNHKCDALKHYTYSNDKEALSFIIQQLKLGSPIISLIDQGRHWILIVGIDYNPDSIRLRVIDNETTRYLSWKKSGILGWEEKLVSKFVRLVGFKYYHAGSFISINPQ